MGDDRPSRYVETLKSGRPIRVVYRASGLGGCERAFVAAARGLPAAPHPQLLLDVWAEGVEAEQQILDMWEAAGAPSTVGQQDELEVEVGEVDLPWKDGVVTVPVIVRAHIDGRAGDLQFPDSYVLRECKKFRDSTWPGFLSKGCEINVLYPWQLAAMMHAIHDGTGAYPLVEMIGGHWDKEAARVTEIAVRYIDNPPIPLRAIKQKVARIERLIAEGYDAIDPEVICTESMYPCPYFKLHPAKPAADAQLRDVMNDIDDNERQAITSETVLTAQINAAVKNVEAMKKERDGHRRIITAALDRLGVEAGDSAAAGPWVVKRVHQDVKAHEVKASVRDYLTISMKEGTA